MFDYISWQGELPDGWVDDGDLQTKTFDCELARYLVTAEGSLLYLNGSTWGESWDKEPEEWIETGYTGAVHFWGGEPGGEPGVEWHEYHAQFVGGRLITINAWEGE